MKILIIGKTGQLAAELASSIPVGVIAKTMGRPELDVSDAASVMDAVMAFAPAVVINAAAYTAVDVAESDAEMAYLVNEQGAKNIAMACLAVGARLLHVSTDFVFGNTSAVTANGIAPLLPESPADPVSVYGASKLAGEQQIQALLPTQSVIVRTAWVYSVYGNNFVKTMLRLMASKPQLGVIYDQVGTPTWAKGLATWLWVVAEKPEVAGIFHWTDAGVTSWYDFAVAIQELAIEKGLLTDAVPINALPTSGYPTPAQRPSYSLLDKTTAEQAAAITPIHWRQQLAKMLDELAAIA
ncbi:MAG: dTDP-4-dehydrorhamnose reductase [Marinagarivorans sp.]|nr:dTDP-4-dehydrorhamnose reductase [Marinagarivorans sp.]